MNRVTDEIVVVLAPDTPDPDSRIREIATGARAVVMGSVREKRSYQLRFGRDRRPLEERRRALEGLRNVTSVIESVHDPLPFPAIELAAGRWTAGFGQTLIVPVLPGCRPSVTFSSTADRPGSRIVAWEWILDGVKVSQENRFTQHLPKGSHVVSLRLLDNAGRRSDLDQAVIYVRGAILPSLWAVGLILAGSFLGSLILNFYSAAERSGSGYIVVFYWVALGAGVWLCVNGVSRAGEAGIPSPWPILLAVASFIGFSVIWYRATQN